MLHSVEMEMQSSFAASAGFNRIGVTGEATVIGNLQRHGTGRARVAVNGLNVLRGKKRAILFTLQDYESRIG